MFPACLKSIPLFGLLPLLRVLLQLAGKQGGAQKARKPVSRHFRPVEITFSFRGGPKPELNLHEFLLEHARFLMLADNCRNFSPSL